MKARLGWLGLVVAIATWMLISLFAGVSLTQASVATDLEGQELAAPAGSSPFPLSWQSAELDNSRSLAWGDVDNDGDLDLAVGNYRGFIRLYRNDDGALTNNAAWSSALTETTNSMAWGDYDGDGDLDLAVGNGDTVNGIGRANRLYRNDNGALTSAAVWTSTEADVTYSLAWGDYDGDGDLDLFAGNYYGPSRLYVNDKGALKASAIWSSNLGYVFSVAWGDYDGDDNLDLAIGSLDGVLLFRNQWPLLGFEQTTLSAAGAARSVAWGDLDGDGYLDLAVGNGDTTSPDAGGVNQVFLNNRPSTSTFSLYWQSTESDFTRSVAWGDYDGDGDLDLAAGNNCNSAGGNCAASRIYRNDGGTLTSSAALSLPSWVFTQSIAWGDVDGDGDLDLALGNGADPLSIVFHPIQLYRNDGGETSSQFSSKWSSPNPDNTTSLAWGDLDGDGDLDLAVGNIPSWNINQYEPSYIRLYRNSGGTLTFLKQFPAAWTYSLAWGDADGDGDLDLAVGHGCFANVYPAAAAPCAPTANQVYRNVNGTLEKTAWWTSNESDNTSSLAWGDVDGDGDLDLAVGNGADLVVKPAQPNRLYRNDNGVLTVSAVWSSAESDNTRSIAWGDVDGDGDLDLAVGNWAQPNRIYRNDEGTLAQSAVWSSTEADNTTSIAWGDYDGDGDLDLAVGNQDQPNRLYRNDGGTLTLAWSSAETDATTSLAWGDYDGDGDLDLAAGNAVTSWHTGDTPQPNRLYRNDDGALSLAWTSPEKDTTTSMAWGDYDGDGDLDLAAGSRSMATGQPDRVYQNSGKGRLGLANNPPTVSVIRPGKTDNAAYYSTPEIIADTIIPITFTLSDPEGDPVRYIRAYFSLDDGRRWYPAVAAQGYANANLAAAPLGTSHSFPWDVFASGFFGQSDGVAFRIEAYQGVNSALKGTAGPYQFAYASSTTFPFRVRGTQVRVVQDVLGMKQPVKDALVYQLPAGQATGGRVMGGSQPFRTDVFGYLEGRGEVGLNDQLIALAPITVTEHYTLYYTNATPFSNTLQSFAVSAGGVQTLTVSSAHPLVLFDLDVSLEWDSRYNQSYLDALKYNLERASEVLYDWTNGQAALGKITVYQNRERWNDAHIRIYASNDIRPSALKGGITTGILTETNTVTLTYPSSISITKTVASTYIPGQVHMGAVWNRYGEGGSSLSDDWARSLAHELGHYLLYLDDNYLGVTPGGQVTPMEGCTGAMSDPYRQDFPYDEFHPNAGWTGACGSTLSQATTGRSDWATVNEFYAFLNAPGAENEGPVALPLAVTQVQFVNPASESQGLAAPTFYLSQNDERVQPGASARAVLYQDGWAIDAGLVVIDHVLYRGAKPGDTVCLYDPAASRQGCEPVAAGDEQLALHDTSGWTPEITVTPITSVTLQVRVTQVAAGASLKARLYPVTSPSPAIVGTIPLSYTAGAYVGQFSLAEPAFVGFVRVWDEATGLEAVTDYSVGGNPTFARGSGTFARGSGTFARGSGAPVMSADGQVILFVDDTLLGKDEYYILQPLGSIPAPLGWARPVGQAYRLSASATAPDLAGASLQFTYLASQVDKNEEQWLSLYYWDGISAAGWTRLPSVVDEYQNSVSALASGQGMYALMSSISLPLHGPAWNLFSYPLQSARPVKQALASISESYTTVYGYFPDASPAWKIYDATIAPPLDAYVNTLTELRFGYGYWIYVTETITAYMGGVNTYAPLNQPLPPATFYGVVQPAAGFKPQAGQAIWASIDGNLCGQALTQAYGEQVVYSIQVEAVNAQSPGCGAEGRRVVFRLEGQPGAWQAEWRNERSRQLDLGPLQRLFLPMLVR